EILDHPQWFPGDKTGTRLAISGLKEVWNRGKVRELKRDITSICSPFEEQETFRVILQVPGHGTWLEDLLDVREVLDLAIWRFSFKFDESGFSWKYRFIPPPGMRLDKREADKENAHLLFPKDSQFADLDARSLLKGIGRVRGKLYAFDLDRGVVGAVKESSFIRSYLNEQGGIRVYRNGLRVYNYGTQGDNWLGLDLKRVQNPTRGISNNLVLGAVNLDLKSSSSLKEKTNREGFVENEGFKKLRDIVLGSLSEFLTLRGKDKERMRLVASSGRNLETRGIDVPLAELRRELVKRDLSEKLGGYVDRIAAAHNQIKEVMLNAGAAGLNLALVFHEVDRGVRFLHEAIRRGRPQEELINQSSHLTDMLGDMVRLLKRGARTRQNVVVVVNRALKIFEYRFRSHGIKMICPPCESSEKDPFVVRSPENMLLAAISNLLDNAIYWTGVRWPKLGENSNDRKILVTVSRDLDAGPALIIADNGPGFSDDPETLVRPFFTHKPDGMGLGLYYASLALQLSGGELVFPEKGDVALPPAYDGAIIGMVFNNTEKREP
ncbi:MAG TPA: HAMP domain-containing histidine kinase, partial [Magnetococcales bacterium]|nr:HAMP domain-containing histidine kinase [Magnetococcales bacterium]